MTTRPYRTYPHVITLEYRGIDHRACAAELLAAIGVFAEGRFTPFGVSFEISCLDPDDQMVEVGAPPRPFWFVRGADFHDARISDDDVVSVVEDLPPTHDIVTAIIEEALAQQTSGVPSLTGIRWEGMSTLSLRGTNRFCELALELVIQPSAEREVWELFEAGVALVEARPGWTR